MKKVLKITVLMLLLLGCSSKLPVPENTALIDKKSLFNLSSLSIETSYNHISGEPKLSLLLSDAAQKRAANSIYFTKFKKGILKLRILSAGIEYTQKRNGNFLYFFPSYDKGLSANIEYTITVYSDRQEVLKMVSSKVKLNASRQDAGSQKELIDKTLDEFQKSIFKTSKEELSAYLASH